MSGEGRRRLPHATKTGIMAAQLHPSGDCRLDLCGTATMFDGKTVRIYSRNKNILFENAETFWDRLARRSAHLMNHVTGPVITKHRTIMPVVSERILEYPLIFAYLGRNPDVRTILDFGSVEDLLPLHLCSLGYSVTALDFRIYPYQHKRLKVLQDDILRWEPVEAAFDAVISISTIEHVGLGYYGDPKEPDGDAIAVQKLWACVKREGTLVFTVPAGKPKIRRGMRIYDAESISKILPATPETLRCFAKQSRYGEWDEVDAGSIERLEYDDYEAFCPAQGVAFVVVRK